ncbi:MAG TPA: EFR1 family ferrodoxin [Candidatus Lokiarchaeia archaeon]|nr:EFR1 family ferrodoxin [Candidatus Lokiarchaeia archaeon]
MKSRIIYLSLSGNTKLAAESVQRGLVDAGHECELFEMRDFAESPAFDDFAGYDLLGFMSPVFAWREPTVWRRFLANLPRLDHPKVFIGATAASIFGNYFHCVGETLAKKGIDVIACIGIRAPPSFVPWNSPDKQNYAWDPQEIEKSVNFGSSLPQIYEDALNGNLAKPPQLKFNLLGALLSAVSAHDYTLHVVLGNKNLNEESCTKCGICVNNCAWEAIDFLTKDSYPHFNESACGACCTCINLCPQGAISTKSTRGKVRNHEPSYTGRTKSKKNDQKYRSSTDL